MTKPAFAGGASESEMSGFVHLVRFTIPPDRRAELIEAARPVVSQTALELQRPGYALLVELEDGEWLSVTIASAESSAADDPAYLELAEGILGEEDGAIVAVSGAGAERGDRPQRWAPDSGASP